MRIEIALGLGILLCVGACSAPEEGERVVNLYSARHYDGDDAVFEKFTRQTGIEINLLQDRADVLLERIASEGNESPADVFVTVDAGRLYQAEQRGIFDPVRSETLTTRVPAPHRHPEGLWFGITKRARVIAYANERVEPGEISRYEELAAPKWKGRVLVRSSSSVYNQSLVGSLIEAVGESAAEAWCKGLVANLARTPQGGDRDQIRALAAGEGDVAIVNSYYYAMMLEGSDDDREAASKVTLLFPNQDGRGAHVNISGAGVVRGAPHREHAVAFLEFLVGDEAQELLSAGANEFPVVPDVPLSPVLASWAGFREDSLNASVFGNHNPLAVQMMDRAGWR